MDLQSSAVTQTTAAQRTAPEAQTGPAYGLSVTVRYFTFPGCPADWPASLDDDVLPRCYGVGRARC